MALNRGEATISKTPPRCLLLRPPPQSHSDCLMKGTSIQYFWSYLGYIRSRIDREMAYITLSPAPSLESPITTSRSPPDTDAIVSGKTVMCLAPSIIAVL
jgi:hypothetical protein